MANPQRSELSSVFDDMLAHNKRRFDELYRSRLSDAGAPAGGAKPSAEQGKDTSLLPIAATSARLEDDSPAVRRLNERFGDDWRYEVTDQHRDGNEAIVLCKLTFGKAGAVRTQFGSAKISGGLVAGASGGVSFEVGHADVGQDERDAFRRATEAALMNCIDLI